MNAFRPKRTWFWIAVAALAIAVIALLLPHAGNAADHQAWVAILPVLFIGLIAPLSVRLLSSVLNLDHAHEAPALAPSFQRPPPAPLA